MMQVYEKRKAVWPLAVLIAVVSFGDLVAVPVLSNVDGNSWIVGTVLAVLSGQSYLALLLALCGHVWMSGVALAVGFVWLALGFLLAGIAWADSLDWEDLSSAFEYAFAFAPTIPGAVVLAAAPLILGRLIFGWRLSRDIGAHTPRTSLSIVDFLSLTTILASLAVMWRLPQALFDSDFDSLMPLLLLTAAVATHAWFVLFPALCLSMRYGFSWLWFHMLLCALPASVLIGAGMAVGAHVEFAVTSAWTGALACQSLTGALIAFVFSRGGFELIRYAPKQTSAAAVTQQAALHPLDTEPETSAGDPSDDAVAVNDQSNVLRSNRRQQHAWTAIVLSAALVCVSMEAFIQFRVQQAAEHCQRVSDAVARTGGSVRSDQHHWGSEVLGITFGSLARDQDLEILKGCNRLEWLHLEKSQITDEGLKHLRSLYELERLFVADTQLTDAAIPSIGKLEQLRALDVSNTRITGEGLKELIRRLPVLYELHADGLDLNQDPEVLKLVLSREIDSLSLVNNKITDELLEQATKIATVSKLDLSENPLTGSALTKCKVNRLVLNRVPLTDDQFGPVVKGMDPNCELELSDTNLTDAFLLQLATRAPFHAITLGDGSFTDEGLAAAKLPVDETLNLHGSQFTGLCFKLWQPNIRTLSMRGSGLTDETVKYVAAVPATRINLSETRLTDACLPTLATFNAESLDLTGTQITADGLSKIKLPNCWHIRIRGKFTGDQIHAMQLQNHVVID